jgi:hypothetical protein
MKRLILLAICVCFTSSCSKSPQQNTPSAQQSTPKKYFYFVRKLDGKVSPLQPDLGEFKDAQRVEGEIVGSIVQRPSGPQEKTKDGGKYVYTYFVTQGTDIELLDNAGLYHAIGSKVSLLVANIEKADVPDMEFLQVGMDPKSNGKLPSGGGVTHLTFETTKQSPGALRMLGELRWKKEGSELVPALHVKTDSGTVDIPLDQLVPFRKKAEQPSTSPAK